MGAVFGSAGRRLVEGVVGLFAVLGFLYVPLGRHTGYEHARAVLSTPAASAAVQELTATAWGLRERAVELVTGRVTAPAPVSEIGATTDPRNPRKSREPRPVPPKLK
jgi:hypothetical protein